MSRNIFLKLAGLLFCIVLVTTGLDTIGKLTDMPVIAYAEQLAECDEAVASDENSDSESNVINEEEDISEEADSGAKEAEDEDSNSDSDDTIDSEAEENSNSESEKSGGVKSDKEDVSADQEPEEVKSEGESEAETFELSDKTGHIEMIRFSRPVKETEPETEAPTQEESMPETEAPVETKEEPVPETSSETESVEETTVETVPETEVSVETPEETKPQTVVPVDAPKKSPHSGGGTTSHHNSVMDYIKNPSPVVTAEVPVPDVGTPVAEAQPMVLPAHRSTPKTGESEDLYMLVAAILILCALFLNAPYFFRKTRETFISEVKSGTRVVRSKTKVAEVKASGTRVSRTRRSHKMPKGKILQLTLKRSGPLV